MRKKILWLVSWYPNKNDAFDGDFIQRHARAAAIYHDVHVIFVTDRIMEQEVEEDLNYATGLTEQRIYFRRTKGLFARLKKQIKWKKLFRKAIVQYVAENGVPHHVHVHVPWKAGLLGVWMKSKYKTSFLVSEHWGIYNESVRDNLNSRSSLMKDLLGKIYRETGKLVVVSRFLGNGIERMIGKKHDEVIPNVVDTTLFHAQEEKYSRFSFLHVSNMVELKNVDLILKAFSQLVQSNHEGPQLILIGNRNDDYVKMANEMGLLNRSVFFKGEISYNEVAEEERRCHCFVLFSDSETFSCVTAEALCCGLPVIASQVGALPELLNHENGMLVEPRKVEALAGAMKRMMEEYPGFDSQLISKKAIEQYGYPAVADRFRALYEG